MNADGLVSTGQGILGTNMFAYCLNNPVMMADYTGTIGVLAILGISAIVIGMAIGLKASDHNTTELIEEQRQEDANDKYTEENVNVFVRGNGTKQENKVNVELIPNNIDRKTEKNNPTIKIYDSCEITSKEERSRIMDIVIANENFSSAIFTRGKSSWMKEWNGHNDLYTLLFWTPWGDNLKDVDLDENDPIPWDWYVQ